MKHSSSMKCHLLSYDSSQIVILPDQPFSNTTENSTLNIIPRVRDGEENTINVIPQNEAKEDNDDMDYNEENTNMIGENGPDDEVGHVPSIEGNNYNKTELNGTIVDLPVVPSTSLNQTLPNSTSVSQSPSRGQTATTNITSTNRMEKSFELKPNSTTPVGDLQQGSTTSSTTTVSVLKSAEPQLNYRWVRSEWQAVSSKALIVFMFQSIFKKNSKLVLNYSYFIFC